MTDLGRDTHVRTYLILHKNKLKTQTDRLNRDTKKDRERCEREARTRSQIVYVMQKNTNMR